MFDTPSKSGLSKGDAGSICTVGPAVVGSPEGAAMVVPTPAIEQAVLEQSRQQNGFSLTALLARSAPAACLPEPAAPAPTAPGTDDAPAPVILPPGQTVHVDDTNPNVPPAAATAPGAISPPDDPHGAEGDAPEAPVAAPGEPPFQEAPPPEPTPADAPAAPPAEAAPGKGR
jgi:hypothetical protein